MIGIFRNNLKTLLLFICIFGFSSLFPTQIITMERYGWVMLFYAGVAALLLYAFWSTYTQLFQKTRWYELLVLIALSLTIHGLVSYFILTFVERPAWPFSDHGTSFLLMNNYYIFAKPLDVLVQQLLIIWLTLKLHAQGLSLKKITIFFLFAFGSLHFFQVFKTDWIIGLLFTAGALISSVVYPYILLRVRNGYIYNYMIHLGIYNIAALAAWLLY